MEIGQSVRLNEETFRLGVSKFLNRKSADGNFNKEEQDAYIFDKHSPKDTDGVIVHIVPKDPLKLKEDELPIWVLWSNGIRNSYKRSWLNVM